jgi:glyoxylase I family protein
MQLTGVAHTALTVSDLARSKEWYAEVLGWEPVLDGEGDGVTFSVGQLPGGILVGLREYEASGAEGFDPLRIGLDHLAFKAVSVAELADWEQHFTGLGVTFTGAQETPFGHVVSFKDPDGIALEIFVDL